MLTALSLNEVIASSNIYGAVDGVTFEAFIASKLVPKLWKNACVVMDNAKIHLREEIRVLIELAGAKLIYLSPYSPEFSPIENFWSKVKANLRKLKAKTYKDLLDAIIVLCQRLHMMISITGLPIAVTVPHDYRNYYKLC